MSKPHLSRLILVGTGLIIAVVLLIWLLLFWGRNPVRLDGFWASPTEMGSPWLAYEEADVNGIVLPLKGKGRPIEQNAFDRSLREHLGKSGNRPVVLYVSAAGVSDRNGGFLLPHEPGAIPPSTTSGARDSLFTLEKLVSVCREFPSKPKLILWDAGQIGSDRNLGVYANGFIHELKKALEKEPNKLAILCSCAPGQTSWASEFDGRSVFGYYVEKGLSGKAVGFDGRSNGLTVTALSQYVRSQVASWVKTNRQAEQTPELVGDPSVNFALPRAPRAQSKPSAAPAAGESSESEDVKRVLALMEHAWTKLDDLRKRKPYCTAPLRWQRLRETLLHAERLFRGGEIREAENVLGGLPGLESDPSARPPMDVSLAMIENGLADQPDEARRIAMRSASDRIDEAVNLLVSEVTPPAAEAAGKAGAGPPKSDPVPKGVEEAQDAPEDADPKDAPREPAPVKKKPEPGPPGLRVRALNPRRRGDSPFAKLTDPGEPDHPLYTEAQLVLWADTFVNRGPDKDAFKGPRGELLERAVVVRRLAEKAAAADERIVRWVMPRVEAGDRLRRQAQDRLFSGDPDALRSAGELLEQATEHYKRAIRVGEDCREARDLVEQLSADLPFYGEWKARTVGRPEEGLGPRFQNLITPAAALAQLANADPPKSDAGGESLIVLDDRADRLGEKYQAVRSAFNALQGEFQGQYELGRWRELDGVLCVPTIPVATRMRLLRKVRTRAVAGTMIDTETASPPIADRAAEARDATGLLKAKSEAYAAERSSDREAAREASSVARDRITDPLFWRHAYCLAELELGLIEIGGARAIDVEKLRTSLIGARAAMRNVEADPASALKAFAEFSEEVRNLRAHRLRSLLGHGGRPSSVAALDEDDRALRVVPLADALQVHAGTDDLSNLRREALLTWHGLRLLEDFAPRHALGVFDKARSFRDSKELQAAVERAKKMTAARLTVELSPRKLTIDEQPEVLLSMAVGIRGDLPEGDAVAFVSTANPSALSIKEKGSQRSAIEGTVVPITRGDPSRRLEFMAEREEAAASAVNVNIRPGAFYRGHIFPADVATSEAMVQLLPGEERIQVKLRQSHAQFVRLYGDQFKRHEDQGFLHPHTSLACKLFITHSYRKPTTIWVKQWMDDLEDQAAIIPDVKLLPNVPNDQVRSRIDADGDNIPVDKPKFVHVEIRLGNANGTRLLSRRYAFRQILPSEYLQVESGFNRGAREAFVIVRHLASDPVNGPVGLTVNIDEFSKHRPELDRGRGERWWLTYPQTPQVIPWSASVEGVVNAFSGKIVTGPPPPTPAPASPPPPAAPAQ